MGEAGWPSEASAKEGCVLHYVYLIESVANPDQRYVGMTSDLKQRLADHNAGKSPHTAKFKPCRPVSYVAFRVARLRPRAWHAGN